MDDRDAAELIDVGVRIGLGDAAMGGPASVRDTSVAYKPSSTFASSFRTRPTDLMTSIPATLDRDASGSYPRYSGAAGIQQDGASPTVARVANDSAFCRSMPVLGVSIGEAEFNLNPLARTVSWRRAQRGYPERSDSSGRRRGATARSLLAGVPLEQRRRGLFGHISPDIAAMAGDLAYKRARHEQHPRLGEQKRSECLVPCPCLRDQS